MAYLRQTYELYEQLYQPGKTVIAAHGLDLAARILQERCGAPMATVHFAPFAILTLYDTPRYIGTPPMTGWPRWLKAAQFWLGDKLLVGPIVNEPINALRGEQIQEVMDRWFRMTGIYQSGRTILMDPYLETMEWAKDDPRVYVFWWLKWEQSDQLPEIQRRVKEGLVQGLKLHSGDFRKNPNPDYRVMGTPEWHAIYAYCEQAELPIVLHLNQHWGDQRYTYDFLYQTEWQDHLKEGNLTKLDVAFSRDQPEKVYVQHRMLDRAKELYGWLQEGAHFYVCGDASRMASDVHEALIAVVEKEGGFSREVAEAYVEDLKKSKRYQRDVY